MPAMGAPVTIVGGTGGSATSPSFEQSVGSGSITTTQGTSSVSPAAATQIIAARAGRRAVTVTNITGTQPVYILNAARTDGVTTGDFIPGTAGASKTYPFAGALFATSPTAAQTVSVVETY